MPHVKKLEDLTAVGDFMVSAVKGETTVLLVTGQDYAGPRRINEGLSDPRLNTVVSTYKPRVETIAASEVTAQISTLVENYGKVASRKARSCIELDVIEYARRAKQGLETARTEIQCFI